MDEKLAESQSQTETVEADAPVASEQSGSAAQAAADTAAATTIRSLDLNELHALSEKKLKSLAREMDVFLHPARSRHQHILDIARAALTGGGTVTAEGFLDQVSDSFAMLRWPKLNFLPLPEDVAIPRALVEKHQLRPGQNIAGTVRLPVQREKFLALNEITTVEGQPAEEWTQPTHFVCAPGHERDLPLSRFVEALDGCVVVEKLDGAGDIARETDPRRTDGR